MRHRGARAPSSGSVVVGWGEDGTIQDVVRKGDGRATLHFFLLKLDGSNDRWDLPAYDGAILPVRLRVELRGAFGGPMELDYGVSWLDQLRHPPRRLDGSVFTELTFESVRVLYLRMTARLMGNRSTSHGEQFLRGRLGLTAGGLLPGGVRLLLEGQLQATRWPEGLGLGERLALQEGDESQTSLSAQLSVPLRSGVWVEGKTAAYTAELSAARTPFLRLIAFAGLSYRW